MPLAYDRLARARYREQSLRHYGQTCACCDTTEDLTIDHVDGDGARHRKELRDQYIYRWLVQNNFPPGFQVLCRPCNSSKHTGSACRIDHSPPETYVWISSDLLRVKPGLILHRKKPRIAP